jgi:hypothetical protein
VRIGIAAAQQARPPSGRDQQAERDQVHQQADREAAHQLHRPDGVEEGGVVAAWVVDHALREAEIRHQHDRGDDDGADGHQAVHLGASRSRRCCCPADRLVSAKPRPIHSAADPLADAVPVSAGDGRVGHEGA